jgi:hypothetical protein
MNRLYHLKETLPQNIEDNLSYPNLEHVLLDYNSRDDMEKWVKENLSAHIKSGRLTYYRTPDPAQFNMAHSKNMVTNLAAGDIVCIVDADNYTGRGYAEYVNKCFNRQPDSFLTTISQRKVKHGPDVLGRVCFRKKDFVAIGGFDEFMSSYGFDDHDFANRLALAGRQRNLISNKKYLQAITHSTTERLSNQKISRFFDRLFIRHIDPAASELIFLFTDHSFSLGIMINNRAKAAMDLHNLLKKKTYKYDESLATEDWIQGTWEQNAGSIRLRTATGESVTLDTTISNGLLLKDGNGFRHVTDQNMITDLLYFHTAIRNRNKMNTNFKQKKIIVNHNGFGKGSVFRNFDNSLPIQI